MMEDTKPEAWERNRAHDRDRVPDREDGRAEDEPEERARGRDGSRALSLVTKTLAEAQSTNLAVGTYFLMPFVIATFISLRSWDSS